MGLPAAPGLRGASALHVAAGRLALAFLFRKWRKNRPRLCFFAPWVFVDHSGAFFYRNFFPLCCPGAAAHALAVGKLLDYTLGLRPRPQTAGDPSDPNAPAPPGQVTGPAWELALAFDLDG